MDEGKTYINKSINPKIGTVSNEVEFMRSVQTDLWCVPLHQPSPRLLTSVTTSPSCSSTSYSELAGNGTTHLQMIHFQRSDVLYKNFQFPSFFIDKDDFQQLK